MLLTSAWSEYPKHFSRSGASDEWSAWVSSRARESDVVFSEPEGAVDDGRGASAGFALRRSPKEGASSVVVVVGSEGGATGVEVEKWCFVVCLDLFVGCSLVGALEEAVETMAGGI